MKADITRMFKDFFETGNFVNLNTTFIVMVPKKGGGGGGVGARGV